METANTEQNRKELENIFMSTEGIQAELDDLRDNLDLDQRVLDDLKRSAEIVRSLNEDLEDISAKRLFEIMTSARDAAWNTNNLAFGDYDIAEVLSYNYPEWADEFKQLAEESEVA